MSETTIREADRRPRTSAGRIITALIAAVVASSAANAVIAVLARAAGASDDFGPLQAQAYLFLTATGVLAGAAGWAAVRRWSRRPDAVLRRLIPAVVAASLIPDVALLFTDVQPHTSGLAVTALIVMHLATAAVAVPLFAHALPVRAAT